jgi:AraC-like DNA-binding protein
LRSLDGNARVQYREYPVPEFLRAHVAGLWHLCDAEPTAEVQTIYPDGFCELIVHLGSPPRYHEDGHWHNQARTLFAAQRLGAVRLRRNAAIDCLGVRLRPEASGLLGAEVLRRSRERIVDLATIDPALSRGLRAASTTFVAGDASKLERLLARRCAAHDIDATVAQAIVLIRDGGGQRRIDSVARATRIGVRSLQVRFRRAVGLTPKEFSRLMRLQAMLRALDAGNAALTDVALDHGFADQAHATRELRRVTGLAPTRLRAALRKDRDGEAAVRLAAAFVRGRDR